MKTSRIVLLSLVAVAPAMFDATPTAREPPRPAPVIINQVGRPRAFRCGHHLHHHPGTAPAPSTSPPSPISRWGTACSGTLKLLNNSAARVSAAGVRTPAFGRPRECRVYAAAGRTSVSILERPITTYSQLPYQYRRSERIRYILSASNIAAAMVADSGSSLVPGGSGEVGSTVNC